MSNPPSPDNLLSSHPNGVDVGPIVPVYVHSPTADGPTDHSGALGEHSSLTNGISIAHGEEHAASHPVPPGASSERSDRPDGLWLPTEERPGYIRTGTAESRGRRRSFQGAARDLITKKGIVKSLQPANDGKSPLCPKCESLDLEFDRFVIPSQKGPSFHGEMPMGTYMTILDRASCPLCKLLVESLGGFNSDIDGNPSCYLRWTPDGMKRIQSSPDRARIVHVTRRLEIVWRKTYAEDLFKKTSEKSYIVLVAPEGRFDAKDTFEDDGAVRKSTLFLGRLLTTVTELVQDSFDLANKWVNVCTLNHGGQCSAQASLRRRSEYELLLSTSFAVVDVEDMRLVPLPRGPKIPKYVAMSYTWGIERDDNKRFRCDDDNFHLLRENQGIKYVMKGLPKAIQDAISLTRKLKIRYLWVDSLCIIQENKWSWANNAAAMDVIYGNAALTICAADNDSDDYGLKALSEHSNKSKYKRCATQFCIDYQKPDDSKPIQLLLSHPSESYIARSRWNCRGWTLQERLLSPRCLIFVDGRMYLQCRSTTMCEDIYSDDKDAIAGWSVELDGAPAHILEKLNESPISVLKGLVEMYTSRDLSRESDILDAFKGISNLITESLGEKCEMIYGLPNSHFDWALLWSSEEKLERRVKETAEEKPEQRVHEKAQDRISKDFPTWSWCGWKGAEVESRGWHGGKVSYKESTIIGSESEFNLYKWLANRTWITYYISNGQGRLRLVWDPKLHKPNEDIEDYRGYKSPKDWDSPSDAEIKEGIYPKYDLHGRRFNTSLPIEGKVMDERHFKRVLGSQLQVVVLKAGHDDTEDYANHSIRPFYQNYLQFFTWSAKFYLVDLDPRNEVRHANAGVKRFLITDKHGSSAGTCLLDEKWSFAAAQKIPQEFIALSFARDFAPDESSFGGLYNGPTSGWEWQLYNVMMLEYRDKKDDRYGIGYRAGIGKMYKHAFSNGLEPMGETQRSDWFVKSQGMYWKEIVLG